MIASGTEQKPPMRATKLSSVSYPTNAMIAETRTMAALSAFFRHLSEGSTREL